MKEMKSRDPEKLFPHDRLLRPFLALIPKRISPNHITVLRMVLTPAVLYLLYLEEYAIGIPLFFITASTDAIDGSLARIRKQITAWGTLWDPIADKVLIGTVLLLILLRHVPIAITATIIVMEIILVIGGFARKRKNILVPASVPAKIKMFFQFSGVMCVLIGLWTAQTWLIDASVYVFCASILLGVISMFGYELVVWQSASSRR